MSALSLKKRVWLFCRTSFSYKLFDKECLGLTQATGIDIQDEAKCGLATLRMQDAMLRQHLIMHASRLDTFSKLREEVQDIARARGAAGGVAPMQVGAVQGKKGKDVKGKGELMQAKMLAFQENDVSCTLVDSGSQ